MNRKFLMVFLLCIFSSGQVNAIIIEGEFVAIITDISDRGAYDKDFRTFWRDIKVGDAIHGTYWYDTEQAPSPKKYWDGKQLQYENSGNTTFPAWSGMTATIDGLIFDTTHDQPDPEEWRLFGVTQSASIGNEADDGYAIWDSFSTTSSIFWLNENYGYSYTNLLFSFRQIQGELFNSTELGQEFNWFNENADPLFNGGAIGKSGYDNGFYEANLKFVATLHNGAN